MNALTTKCPIHNTNVDIDFHYNGVYDTYYVQGVQCECDCKITFAKAYEMLLDEIQSRSEARFESRWER